MSRARRIAVIGGGVSGLCAADLLGRAHEVELFEAAPTLGGHAHTVEIDVDGVRRPVDTAFVVYNERAYPRFSRLVDELGVETRVTRMGFSVRDDAREIEVASHAPKVFLSRARHVLRPEAPRLLWDAARFLRLARRWARDPSVTLGDLIDREGFGVAFVDFVILPLTASAWSIDFGRARAFPLARWLAHMEQHGFATPFDTPSWRAFPRGSRAYVDALAARIRGRLHTAAAVRGVRRADDGVHVSFGDAGAERFDEVVLAVHADQALALLDGATAAEREALSSIPFGPNDAILHDDASVLPKDRRGWSTWNYLLRDPSDPRPTLTYLLSEIHGFPSRAPVCLSLNEDAEIRPESVRARFSWAHPRFDARAFAAQRALIELSGRDRIHFAGAYLGMGFHEDGVAGAFRIAERLGVAA